MASNPAYVALTMGTHTWNPEDEKVDKIVELMRKYGIKNMDTARTYVSPPISFILEFVAGNILTWTE